MVEEKKPKKLIHETYLTVIGSSIKTQMFRSFFVKQDNKKLDATENGTLSCAFYVSAILKMFSFVENIHGTVKSTIEDLEKSGWKKINKPKPGSILVWEKQTFEDGEHMHVGFYIGGNRAISNDHKKRYPVNHDWRFNGKRKIVAIYWKNLVNKKEKNGR